MSGEINKYLLCEILGILGMVIEGLDTIVMRIDQYRSNDQSKGITGLTAGDEKYIRTVAKVLRSIFKNLENRLKVRFM